MPDDNIKPFSNNPHQKRARLKSSRSKEPSPGRGKNKDGRVAF